jgi:hypothetical protein
MSARPGPTSPGDAYFIPSEPETIVRTALGPLPMTSTDKDIRILVLRLARENPTWSCCHTHDELATLAIKIAPRRSGTSSRDGRGVTST